MYYQLEILKQKYQTLAGKNLNPMFRFYTPILILQGFCLYHAYKNNSEQKWYWLIVFFPVIGCLIYLYHHFYNRKNINDIAEVVNEVVNNNFRLEKLEKEYEFNDSITNAVNLADEYVRAERYEDAIKLYQECLEGYMEDDPHLMMKLLQAQYLNKNYKETVKLGKKLSSEKEFQNAMERVAYAWALHHNEKTEKAEKQFQDMDQRFVNYKNRMEYGKFLIENDRKEDANKKLEELIEEFNHMERHEKKIKRKVLKEIKDLHASLN